ncbi:hypothetical protein RJ640_020153, partial [Escallonia rubra]
VRMADREAGSSGKDADNALKDMYVILGRMVPCMENQQNNNLNHRGFNHDLEGQGKSEMLKNFMNMHPPDFVGEGDPDKAENLIMNMERTFKTMGRNDEMKLLLATLRLENDAARRWKMIDSKWIAAQTVRTWELFKTEFGEHYIPRSVKPTREDEFRNFELGNLTAQQYATKFTSLARHASYLVEGEDKRARKFQDGLKPEIQEKISIRNVDDYYEMVDRALLIEKSDGDIQRKRARLSGTRPNASKWQVGRNLNTCGAGSASEPLVPVLGPADPPDAADLPAAADPPAAAEAPSPADPLLHGDLPLLFFPIPHRIVIPCLLRDYGLMQILIRTGQAEFLISNGQEAMDLTIFPPTLVLETQSVRLSADASSSVLANKLSLGSSSDSSATSFYSMAANAGSPEALDSESNLPAMEAIPLATENKLFSPPNSKMTSLRLLCLPNKHKKSTCSSIVQLSHR